MKATTHRGLRSPLDYSNCSSIDSQTRATQFRSPAFKAGKWQCHKCILFFVPSSSKGPYLAVVEGHLKPMYVWHMSIDPCKHRVLTVSTNRFMGLEIHFILHNKPWSEHIQHGTDVAHDHLQSMTSSFFVTKLAEQTAFQEVLGRPPLLHQQETRDKPTIRCLLFAGLTCS